ncbi:DUF6653 family protein [Streptosporangium carneum]|nr:DUF6653 family protein [Streptosporangium carneum]
MAGFALIAYGLVVLELWPTVFGTTPLMTGRLWRIDRYVVLHERQRPV